MTKVLLLQLIAALALALAIAGPEVAMTFDSSQALADGSCGAVQPLMAPNLMSRIQPTSGQPHPC